MRLIEWTLSARGDLRGIDQWLEREASSETALATLIAIRERADFLTRFPHGGRPHHDGTRVLRVFRTPYLIRYRLNGNRVEVLRVHHEREDWISFTP